MIIDSIIPDSWQMNGEQQELCEELYQGESVSDLAIEVVYLRSALQAETTRRLEAEKTIDMLCDDRIDVLDADLEAKAYRAKYPK